MSSDILETLISFFTLSFSIESFLLFEPIAAIFLSLSLIWAVFPIFLSFETEFSEVLAADFTTLLLSLSDKGCLSLLFAFSSSFCFSTNDKYFSSMFFRYPLLLFSSTLTGIGFSVALETTFLLTSVLKESLLSYFLL